MILLFVIRGQLQVVSLAAIKKKKYRPLNNLSYSFVARLIVYEKEIENNYRALKRIRQVIDEARINFFYRALLGGQGISFIAAMRDHVSCLYRSGQ